MPEQDTKAPTPEGQLYSRLYLEKTLAFADSARARTRVYGYYSELGDYLIDGLRSAIQTELGVRPPAYMEDFFKKAELRDFLDSLTLLHAVLSKRDTSHAARWRNFVQRVFDEEGLPYRIDSRGGVHPTVDREFDRTRQSIIRGLDEAALKSARVSMDAAFDAMRVEGSDTLAMVRNAFDALENHLKSKFSVARLGTKEIDKHIRPLIASKYDGRAAEAANLLVSSYAKLVDAAHQYRHADGEPEPTPPPLELAVAFVALSAAFLRLLLDLVKA